MEFRSCHGTRGERVQERRERRIKVTDEPNITNKQQQQPQKAWNYGQSAMNCNRAAVAQMPYG